MIDCSKCIHEPVCGNKVANDGQGGTCYFSVELVEGSDYHNYCMGYLKGCEDTTNKINELNKIRFSKNLREDFTREAKDVITN